VSIRFEVLKTGAGAYGWRLMHGDAVVLRSPEFASAQSATASADQMIALAMLMVRIRRQIEIHNLTGEEI
jgi:UDP-2,3-diacylglucosamine pyrophosphatase LpxH